VGYIGGTSQGDSTSYLETYAIPTLAHELVGPTSTSIATLRDQTISTALGDNTLVINSQVTTAGGLITLAGSNNAASLGPSGLVIQYPGGGVSAYSLPTPALSTPALVDTVTGIQVYASPGASMLSIGSQAVIIGGSPVTTSGDVVSLGASGAAIQKPGGGMTTLSVQLKTGAAVSSKLTSISSGMGTVTSRKGIASIIASSMLSLLLLTVKLTLDQ
jgi:hypothetical protein